MQTNAAMINFLTQRCCAAVILTVKSEIKVGQPRYTLLNFAPMGALSLVKQTGYGCLPRWMCDETIINMNNNLVGPR